MVGTSSRIIVTLSLGSALWQVHPEIATSPFPSWSNPMPPGHAYTEEGLIARIVTKRHMAITLLKGAVHGLSVPILRPTGKGDINVGYVNRFFGGQRGI